MIRKIGNWHLNVSYKKVHRERLTLQACSPNCFLKLELNYFGLNDGSFHRMIGSDLARYHFKFRNGGTNRRSKRVKIDLRDEKIRQAKGFNIDQGCCLTPRLLVI